MGGADVIVFRDESPEGRAHETWRIVSEKGLAALTQEGEPEGLSRGRAGRSKGRAGLSLLERVVKKFAVEVGPEQLCLPSKAKGACKPVSARFDAFARAAGLKVEGIAELQFRYPRERTIAFRHHANLIEGKVVDWTINQFVEAPVPAVFDDVDEWIQTISESHVGRRYEEPDLEEILPKGLSSGKAAPLVFFHGAHRWEGPPEIRPSKTKKVAVHGPGIYLTTHRGTAERYARGGGVVMRMEVSPDLRLLSDAELPVEDMIAFVRAVPRMRKKKEIESDLIRYATRVKKNVIPANVVLNLMNHYEVGYGEPGQELVRFYVSRGIDGDIVDHVLFGGMEEGEKWLVLFNTDKVLRYERSRTS